MLDYHKQRNDILLDVADFIVMHTPITRASVKCRMGNQTYYGKMEIIYQRCLEFLSEHEAPFLASGKIDSLWLCTDILNYELNNKRRKGKGGERYKDIEKRHLLTQIIATADMMSGYVIRTDVAFDWDVRLIDVIASTYAFSEDHLHNYCRRYGRLRRRLSYWPRRPCPNEDEDESEEVDKLKKFRFVRRMHYIEDAHVSPTYTALAHFWLLRQNIKAHNFYLVTDNDVSLRTALLRVFAREVRIGAAHYFICDNDQTRVDDSYKVYLRSRQQLRQWGLSRGLSARTSSRDLAIAFIEESLNETSMYQDFEFSGERCWASTGQFIDHPLPALNEGFRKVTCKTDLHTYSPREQAELLYEVNIRAVDLFFEKMRRRFSPLERPLDSARGEQQAYIFSNWNPRYAHMAAVIMRVYHNYCVDPKSPIKKVRRNPGKKRPKPPFQTPAMRIGIVDRPYTLAKIIYPD